MKADLGIGARVPVMQSGMRGVAGADLAAAVSNAGGVGVLAVLGLKPDVVRDQIRAVRALTDQPFGVNIWLHDDVRTQPDVDLVPADIIGASQAVLNEFRGRFDLPPTTERPPPRPDVTDAALDVMIDERIPVFSAGLGLPEPELVERFHAVGTKVVSMVATLDDAITAAGNGVDAVIAQGSEAGGHRSFGSKVSASDAMGKSLFALLPEVVDAIGGGTPVIAAGGIADGRGVAAAIALGARGALLGTRFVATAESMANDAWKQAVIAERPPTTLTDGYSGQWARVIETDFTDRWSESGVTPPPGLLQASMMADLQSAAKAAGDVHLQPLYAGTSASLIDDLPGAGEVVARIAEEIRATLKSALSSAD